MSKIKVAVFGLNQGARIARLFKENDEVELTAVAGFGQQAIDVASEVGAKLYEDYNDLLANETLDGVAIALPNSPHLSATKACCEAGIKNILLEKPIANTPEEGQAIIDCCNEHNATLLIGHHRRSSNLFLFLKEFLATGKLGDIIGIQSSFAIAKEKHYWDAEWHKEPEGAILLVNAIHDLDDLNNVLNMKATRVYAAKRNTIRGYNAEDSVSALFEFEGGATATYFISDGTPSPWNYDLLAGENEQWAQELGPDSMHIFGTKGSFGFPSMTFYHYPSDKDEEYGWRHPLEKEVFSVEPNNPMESEILHFIDLCAGRASTPRCTGEQGLASLKIINATIESAKSGKIVEIR